MRFKKGSKVEVINKNEVPKSWRVAEIISGNRHTYSLRYDCYPGVEKVSRKFIRPCPPPAEGLRSWVTGDIVEVFDDSSWKTATVSEVLGGGRYSVRTHGLTHEIRVHKLHIRARQCWRDGQWVPIGKISGSHEEVKVNKKIKPNHHLKSDFPVLLPDAKIRQQEADCLPVYNDAGLQESRVVSSKTLKRSSPFDSSLLETRPRKAKKFKAAEKGHNQRLVAGRAFKKVDAFDSDNAQCSVGSCSVSSDRHSKFSRHYIAVTDIVSGDAESFTSTRDEERNRSPPPEKEVAESIHRLELDAYRSTLEALYASGPLSWEKEALLTNLRINLHISNDEHLREVRHLITFAAGNCE